MQKVNFRSLISVGCGVEPAVWYTDLDGGGFLTLLGVTIYGMGPARALLLPVMTE